MKDISIASIINFCTNDIRFLQACVEGVRPFSSTIVIAVCDHYFDGTAENYALLEHAFNLCPDCLFVEYPFDAQESYRRFTPYFPEHPYWRHEWHNTGRWIGYYFAPSDSNYLLFLDVDEIVDGMRFAEWSHHSDILHYSALRLSAYWYFREARYRATSCDDGMLLVAKKALHPDHLWSIDERMGIFLSIQGNKKRDVQGLDHAPLVNHYSWVRTQDELRKKFVTWGHYWERPWLDLLDAEYAQPFQGQDFIRRYTYEEVAVRFDPLAVNIPVLAPVSLEQHRTNLAHFSNVVRVDKTTMQHKELLDLVENDRPLNSLS